LSTYDDTFAMTPDTASPPLTISSSRQGNATILAVCGDIDLLTIDLFRQAIEGAFRELTTNLLVDLTQTTFLASAGLKALEQARERSEATGAMFAVVTSSASTSRPIIALQLEQVLDLHSTVDEVMELWSRPDVRWPEPSPLESWWVEVMSRKGQTGRSRLTDHR
jgi:anti-sigma B factor antagonist